MTDLSDVYRAYISCLNRQDWTGLGAFVGENVHYNGRRIGLSGYRELLEDGFARIPDLSFKIELLVVEEPHVASRLRFECSPKGEFLGLAVNGKRITFTENVFYRFHSGQIEAVWSIIDKAAIEAQL